MIFVLLHIYYLVIYSKEGKITKVEKGPFDVAKLHKNGNKVRMCNVYSACNVMSQTYQHYN